MRQIPLDLTTAEPPSFENYVAASNQEAVALLRALAAGPLRATPSVWLWGEPGSGKTHLANALAATLGARALRLGPGAPLDQFRIDPAAQAVIIDDCDRLDGARQEAAFHLYNRVRADRSAAFVATGGQPPLVLTLRDDLRTRLGWGVVLRLGLLTDNEKADALRRAACGRGVALPEELIHYLLTQRSRDIRWLLHRLEALDRFSLERKRAITLPLLREFESAGPLLK